MMLTALILLSIAVVFLAGTIIYQSKVHAEERKQLLNRIMARDYQEYAISQYTSRSSGGKNNFFKPYIDAAKQRERDDEE